MGRGKCACEKAQAGGSLFLVHFSGISTEPDDKISKLIVLNVTWDARLWRPGRFVLDCGLMKTANRPATASPIATPKPVAGLDYYFDAQTGLLVFTAHYLARRGFCCGNGCRHCPYLKEKE